MLKLISVFFIGVLVSFSSLATDRFFIASYIIRNIADQDDMQSILKLYGVNQELVSYYFYPDGVTLPNNYSQNGNIGKVYSIFEHQSKYESYRYILRNYGSVRFLFHEETGRADLLTDGLTPVGQ